VISSKGSSFRNVLDILLLSDLHSKNEGEPLHIVSPSTIPLTLGEEVAVLCCQNYFSRLGVPRNMPFNFGMDFESQAGLVLPAHNRGKPSLKYTRLFYFAAPFCAVESCKRDDLSVVLTGAVANTFEVFVKASYASYGFSGSFNIFETQHIAKMAAVEILIACSCSVEIEISMQQSCGLQNAGHITWARIYQPRYLIDVRHSCGE